jgi:hypothetical protein
VQVGQAGIGLLVAVRGIVQCKSGENAAAFMRGITVQPERIVHAIWLRLMASLVDGRNLERSY